MAIELVRDLLIMNQTVGEGNSQVLVEGDILVPDIKPDISRILSVDGVVNIKDKQAVQDKIIIDGMINFKILYVSEGGEYPVYSMDASAGFRQNIDIPNTLSNMDIDVNADVEHIDFNIMNERKIAVKTVVSLNGKSHMPSRVEIIKDILGVENAQVLKNRVTYSDIIGSNKSQTMVRESFELEEGLPDIDEILKCNAVAAAKEIQVTDGKVIVSGVAKINTLYIADDGRNTLLMLKHEIPFTHFVEVAGAMRKMDCKVVIKADEVHTEVKEDIDGNKRSFDIEAMIKIDASVSEIEEKEVMIDAYSPRKSLNIERQKFEFGQTVGKNNSNMVIKETIELPKGEPEIAKVFNANCKTMIMDASLTDDKCILEGVLEANILYISKDEKQPICSIDQEIPFRHFVEVPGSKENMEVNVDILVNDIDCHLVNSSHVDLKANIGVSCLVTTRQEMDVVVHITEAEEQIDISKKPSITIYYVQPGDTLWKIAKKYHTTVKELVETNDIQNPDSIMPGDQIIIQKKVSYKH